MRKPCRTHRCTCCPTSATSFPRRARRCATFCAIQAKGDAVPDTSTTIHGVPAFLCGPTGKHVTAEGDAVDLISRAREYGAQLVVVPVERLTDKFFRLK